MITPLEDGPFVIGLGIFAYFYEDAQSRDRVSYQLAMPTMTS